MSANDVEILKNYLFYVNQIHYDKFIMYIVRYEYFCLKFYAF